MIAGMFIINLYNVNSYPRAPISNNSVENFVTHHAFKNIITFENLTPFFIKTEVNGNPAYKGPAAKNANINDKKIPINLELFPIYFIKYSLGIHSSKRPNNIIVGGKTDNIWIRLDLIFLSEEIPIS